VSVSRAVVVLGRPVTPTDDGLLTFPDLSGFGELLPRADISLRLTVTVT
jgi:hypothetical protein